MFNSQEAKQLYKDELQTKTEVSFNANPKCFTDEAILREAALNSKVSQIRGFNDCGPLTD